MTTRLPGAPAAYSGTTSYQYDYGQSANPQLNRNQVTGEASTRNTGYTNVFGYDGSTSGGPGNPTSFKGTTNAFNADNQLTNTGYGYDGNGNPTTYNSQSLSFDPENRMITSYPNRLYLYDGDGHQIKNNIAGHGSAGVLYQLYDGDTLINQYNGVNYNGVNSSLQLIYSDTFGADGVVSVHDYGGGKTIFYTFDERGNTAQRLNSSAAVQSSDLYDAYGVRTSANNTTDFVGFGGQAGYYSYASGLILCTHRYYDPSNGRWLTRDPMGYAGGVNLYGYVQNSPVGWDDPLGYDMAAGAIISGGLRLAAGTELVGLGPENPVADGVAGAILLGAGLLAGGVILYDQLGKLPTEGGPPDGSLSEDSGIEGGNKGQIRDYGPDGRAKCDYDINHPAEDGPNPHAHDWNWHEDGGPPQRMHPGRALNPGE